MQTITVLPQPKDVEDVAKTIRNHLGKFYYSKLVLFLSHNLIFFLDECELCCTPSSVNPLLSALYSFLTTQLLPELTRGFGAYTVWWTFKEDSPLKIYFEENNIELNQYFTPQELVKCVENIFYQNWSYDAGNSSIIILEHSPLQSIFETNLIFRPKLEKHCLPHVNNVYVRSTLETLQNNHILNNLPSFEMDDIIYNDDSSNFYVHPILAELLNVNKTGNTWSSLLLTFQKFCRHNQTHFFTQPNSSIITVRKESPLADLLAMNFFHISQCEIILKSLTFYLGKTRVLPNVCPHLKFKLPQHIAIFYFINNLFECNTDHLRPNFGPFTVKI